MAKALLNRMTVWVGVVAAVGAVAAASADAVSTTTVIGAGQVARGIVLVNSSRFTLYAFTRDDGKSSCYGECATVWQPLVARGPVVAMQGSGVSQSLLHKTRRANGSYEISYNGHPLYLFAADKQPGQSRGEGKQQFDGRWYVVSRSGNLLKPRSFLVGGY